MRASRQSTLWTTPLLPRNSKVTLDPFTLAWALRSVVNPYERFARAYSSLPTRISVRSRSSTTVATTFSRGSPGRAEVCGGTRAQLRQRRGELEHPAVLHLVAHLAPPRVIAVLLAAARIAAGGLHVAERMRADPHVPPRRRDGERRDPADRLLVGHGASVGIHVAEARTAEPADARRASVVHVAESRGGGRGAGPRAVTAFSPGRSPGSRRSGPGADPIPHGSGCATGGRRPPGSSDSSRAGRRSPPAYR